MRRTIWVGVMAGGLLGSLLLQSPDPLAAQQARRWTLGVSAGPGAVRTGGRLGSWDFGATFGGQVALGNRRSVASLVVDVQPFRAEGSVSSGDFRAIYVIPSYAVGSASRRIRLGLGLGVFEFKGGTMPEGWEVGVAAGASGSLRLARSFSIELGWKNIANVRGVRGQVWTLQFVRIWSLGGRAASGRGDF